MKRKRYIKTRIIKIPHLLTQIVVKNKRTDSTHKECEAYTQRLCAEELVLSIPLPITGPHTGAILAHEIVHVLQHLVDDNNMSFPYEREHMAYIAGYLFKKIAEM